jgi:NAD(P)-dependent dehydrogenase (short-subunit alcohol dehydrogenase family)
MNADRPVGLITAASRGIGAACARRLAAEGYAVVLLARSPEISDIATALGGVGVTGSVSVAADLERFVATALDRFGRIDAVIANSGHPAKGELLEISDTDWMKGVDLLLLSVIRLARLVTPAMLRQGGGAMLNLSSLWAVEPHLDAPVSSTLRGALGNFTKLYADRYASSGIRMNCLLPGFMSTYPVAEKFQQAIPMGRVADPDEIAGMAAFLVSPAAAYVTGQSIRADGGLTRSV